ncbi:acyl-CoA thioesterase [Oceanobacillus sp. 1P07AA]|uniref:acyl-CoA thioesterase n=1 Tax=Oceanobacillus sp. 1P07AA TaxID=3132293 RepID=UPI0039A6A9DE
MNDEIEVYVRFSETDMLGHVNNTSYFLYFEEARTKFFKKVHPNRDSSFGFILASIKCDFLKQAYGDESLKISTNISKIGTKSFHMQHILVNNQDEKIAQASAVIVCFNYEEQQSVAIPAQLRENLEAWLASKVRCSKEGNNASRNDSSTSWRSD